MYKIGSLLVMAFLLYTGIYAQKKYIYEEPETTEVAPPVQEVAPPSVDERYDDSEESGEESYATKKQATVLYHFPLVVEDDTVTRWKNMNDFAYAKYLDSLLRQKKLTVEEQKRRLEKEVERNRKTTQSKEEEVITPPEAANNFLDSPFIKVIFWILAIAFILFILYSLFLRDSVFRKPVKKVKNTGGKDPGILDITEPLSEIDRKIRDAVQQGNYRLAVRYQYIKSLQQLVEKKRVSYTVDKTNFQYVNEITDPTLRNDFASLTLNYEYVWYGEFDIDESVYNRMATAFNGFYGKI